jgi:hypothetical protein
LIKRIMDNNRTCDKHNTAPTHYTKKKVSYHVTETYITGTRGSTRLRFIILSMNSYATWPWGCGHELLNQSRPKTRRRIKRKIREGMHGVHRGKEREGNAEAHLELAQAAHKLVRKKNRWGPRGLLIRPKPGPLCWLGS